MTIVVRRHTIVTDSEIFTMDITSLSIYCHNFRPAVLYEVYDVYILSDYNYSVL